jgi:lipopolysaccharide export system protein LptA
MRRSRWLILAAILGIVVFVGATYFKRKETLAKDAPAAPTPLETGIDGRANDWVYTQSDGTLPRVTVRARSFRQLKAPSAMELDGVELQLFHKDGRHFDLVKSATAQFDIAAKSLYSDGDVEISMGQEEDAPPHGRILKIHSSGVRFASDTGKASTGRPATFEFDQGGGSATGAEYDPAARQLHLLSRVSLDLRGKTRASKPMHIEAGEAFYREGEEKVVLQPWSKLTRDTLHMEAGASIVTLEKGTVRRADAQAARGVQDDPGRKVEFAADQIQMQFGDGMVIKNVKGQRNGKLISTAAAMRTTVTADALNLDFDTASGESTLSTAVATGKSVAEAQPLPRAGELLSDTRILRSDVIHLKMRARGQEIESVETDGPGTVDFLPNRPDQPKRWLKGDRIWIAYGPENRIQSFRSVNASTRTEKPGQPPPPPLLTTSKEILATFDPKTSELARLEQKTDFHYEEGVRHATANQAALEQATGMMTLEGSARFWDPTGSAAADRILMNQKSGDFEAQGRVATTRMPDQKGGTSSGMLSNTDVMQARAQRMTSAEQNQKIHYEGNAVVWQGANRVEADRIDIDRTRQAFDAHGKVVSQFIDKPKEKLASTKSKAAGAPVFTVVRAPDLTYTDQTRVAHYQGGAAMTRPGLTVNGKEIRAFLKEGDADSSLDKALADGTVKIVSTADKRTRIGTSDHAEYYAEDQKVFLDGGDPLLVDSLKGQTRGKQLTWWANNDRLLVNGAENKPADSLLHKK